MEKIPRNKFKLFIKTLLELDKIFLLYNQKKEKEIINDSGYLVDKKSFDDIKSNVYYSIFKSYVNDDSKFDTKMKELFGNFKDITYNPLEQKIFKTSKEFLNDISIVKEYIIINYIVWKMINNKKYKEDEGKTKYQIKGKNIIIRFDNGDNADFKYDLNVIKFNNLISRTGNFNNSLKIVIKSKDLNENGKKILKLFLFNNLFNTFLKLL